MKFYLCNAFSINMMSRDDGAQDISFVPVTIQAVKNLLDIEDWQSAIGHEDTAAVLSSMIGVEIEPQRINVQLLSGETSLIVCQYTGPRLPEGATELPEGAEIKFWQVYHADTPGAGRWHGTDLSEQTFDITG